MQAYNSANLKKLYRRLHLTKGLIFLTIIAGGFVAGLDAGLIYNTFPLMGEGFVPDDIWASRLGWRNVTENPSTVQFIHRVLVSS